MCAHYHLEDVDHQRCDQRVVSRRVGSPTVVRLGTNSDEVVGLSSRPSTKRLGPPSLPALRAPCFADACARVSQPARPSAGAMRNKQAKLGKQLSADGLLNDEDQMHAQMLCNACEELELADLWCAAAADCGTCGGFPFRGLSRGGLSDVQAQLGVCGCLVALEMEMEEAYLPPPKFSMKTSLESIVENVEAVDSRLLRMILALPDRGRASTEALKYLQRMRHDGREKRAANSMGGKSTYMMMRNREKKQASAAIRVR